MAQGSILDGCRSPCEGQVLGERSCSSYLRTVCSNRLSCGLAKCCDASMFALAAKYHIEPHDVVRSSVARLNDSFWFYFSELV